MVLTSREQGNTFASFHLFSKTQSLDASAARFAQSAQFLTLDPVQLKKIMAKHPQAITLVLPYNSEEITVDLVQANIEAPGFSVLLNAGADVPAGYPTGLHYRGMVRGTQQSLAAISFFDQEIMGVVSDESHNNLVLGKVQQPDNLTGYMFYSDEELAMDNPFECAVLEPEEKTVENATIAANQSNTKTLRLFLEATQAVYRNRGDVQATVNYLAGLFNQTAALYANEGIQLTLSHLAVWVTPDPYSVAGNSGILEQFRRVRNTFDGDLAHLVGLSSTVSESKANWNTLCKPEYAVAYSGIQIAFSHVPTFAWATEVMAHEIGHNLGARHTQWCGWPGGAIDHCQLPENGCPQSRESAAQNSGTIMNYCPMNSPMINFSQGFGPLPGNLIRNTVGHSPCLSAPARVVPARTKATTSLATEKSVVLQLAPNPASRQVSIQLNLDTEQTIRIDLLDLTGRPVLSQTATLKSGDVNLDLSGLAKGIYLVQVTGDGKPVMTKRLIKE